MNHSIIARNVRALGKKSAVNGGQKAVLFALASRAKDSGKAWPGYECLAHDSGISRRQLIRIVTALEESGILKVSRAKVRPGQNRSNQYQLFPGIDTRSVEGPFSWMGTPKGAIR